MSTEKQICLLCEKRVLPYEPITVALAKGEGGEVHNLPVHFSCFGEMIAGTVAEAVLDGMDGKSYPQVHLGGEKTLRGGLRKIVMRLVGEFLDDDDDEQSE